MRLVTPDQARDFPIIRNGVTAMVRHYYGTTGVVHTGPQSFLLENPNAAARIEPHFHDSDQFQVIIGGDGKVGVHDAAPVVFHYADAFTPYGPIVAGAQGISFFTMRATAVGGVFNVPGARHLMQGKPGRNMVARFDIERPLPPKGESRSEALIAPQADGVEAIGLRLGPNATAPGISSGGGGQYCLVCAGSILDQGNEAPARSVIYLEPGEAAPQYQAGAAGAQLLIMQFSQPSERPGSDPAKLASRDPGSYRVVK